MRASLWMALLLTQCTATPATKAAAGPGSVTFTGGLAADSSDADAKGQDSGGHDSSGNDAKTQDVGPDATIADGHGGTDAGQADASSTDAQAQDAGPDGTPEDVPLPTGPYCGDGLCTSPETMDSCAVDCKAAVCGDGWCQSPESPLGCSLDCDAAAVAALACLKSACSGQIGTCLGNSLCTSALDAAMACLGECGSGACDSCKTSLKMNGGGAGTAVAACDFSSCAGATPGGLCGDDECGAKESSATCPYDCQGGSAAVCGDGVCSPGETQGNCATDCKPVAKCGDGQCAGGESAASCPVDCKVAATCGDAICQGGENATGCPFDCDPTVQPKTLCGNQKCPAESAACFSDPACAQILKDAYVCLAKCGSSSGTCLNQCAGPVLGDDKALALATCGQQNCP